jgi:hypothetical protein
MEPSLSNIVRIFLCSAFNSFDVAFSALDTVITRFIMLSRIISSAMALLSDCEERRQFTIALLKLSSLFRPFDLFPCSTFGKNFTLSNMTDRTSGKPIAYMQHVSKQLKQ